MSKLNDLPKKYPVIFTPSEFSLNRAGYNKLKSESEYSFCFECDEGWYDVLDRMFSVIEPIAVEAKEKCPDDELPRVAQIKEKFGCYDEETEVLTKNGWKFFKDVVYDDKIACLKDDLYLEYNSPSDIISYHYKGDMYKIKTRGVDLLVTPNHNLYLSKGSYYDGKVRGNVKKVNYPYELVNYTKYYLKNKRFKKSALWVGENVDTFILPSLLKEWSRGKYKNTRKFWSKKPLDMNAWLEFLGWFVAEGCASPSKGEITIACNNTDKGIEKEIVSKVIQNIGYEIKISGKEKSALSFKIYDRRLSDWLLEHCGYLSQNKKAPEFIKNLCPDQIKIFLKALYAGDGHKSKTAFVLTTVSKKLSDDVQELILKCGDSSRIYFYKIGTYPIKTCIVNGRPIVTKRDVYDINWHTRSGDHNTQNKGLSPSSFEGIVNYDGMVYCVTVPDNIVFVRKNGIPVWCGNSIRVYIDNSYNFAKIKEAIELAEKESGVICEMCGQPGKMRSGGWWKVHCDGCHEKWLKR